MVEAACAGLERERAAADAALAAHTDPGTRLGEDGITVRELLVHRVEEYARHCGHADLLRECVDGRVAVASGAWPHPRRRVTSTCRRDA